MTLSGNLDFAYGNASGNTTVKGQTVTTRDFTASTSVINIVAVEDLGGGMKATVKYGIDPRYFANNNNQKDESSATQNAAIVGLGRDELFVGIEGGFGNLKLGSPNSIGLTSFLGGSLLGTGIGSGYAPVTNGVTHSYSHIRYDRSVRYDSPNFNGFTVSALYAPGNDEATATSVQIPNARKATELGISYVNGPLSVSYANLSQSAQTNAITSSSLFGTSAKTSVNILNASYKMGNTTLVAGWNDGDTKGNAGTVADTSGYRVGVRQDIGAIALIAQYTEQKAGATDVKSKVMGLRADYSLSKTAAVYLGYENYDNGATSANSRKLTAVGLRKSF